LPDIYCRKTYINSNGSRWATLGYVSCHYISL
jgi:hypothetical protein